MTSFVPLEAIPYLEARGWHTVVPSAYPDGTFAATYLNHAPGGRIASHSYWSQSLMQFPYEDIPLELAKDARRWTQDVLSWRLENEKGTG